MFQRIPFATGTLEKRSIFKLPGWERKVKEYSGWLNCELEVVTPLCIKSLFEFERAKNATATQVSLPGSSLRGMVRNTAEILGAGCGRYYSGYDLPQNLKECRASEACMVCRIFGFVSGQDTWQSRVRFEDSSRAAVKWKKVATGRGFSVTSDPPPLSQGWAVFVHRPKPSLDPGIVPCVESGAKFPFRVEYMNLDDLEFAVFRFALTLDYGGEHLIQKMGFAKSQGLGSCRVRVLDEKARPIGKAIEPYLQTEAFAELCKWRRP